MNIAVAFFCLVGLAAAAPVLKLTQDATCPKAQYLPVTKSFSYSGYEPPQRCFNASASPGADNGFTVVFDHVAQPTNGDQICLLMGYNTYTSSGDLPYVVSSCGVATNSSVVYGGTCSARALATAYWIAIGSKSALITPSPLHTNLDFSLHIEYSHTYVC